MRKVGPRAMRPPHRPNLAKTTPKVLPAKTEPKGQVDPQEPERTQPSDGGIDQVA